eukprot:TRINITY_DN14059_c0_g1_i1.p1 TRINITY_DN14059_c0_g1~~TRINITY_DN14059_c0_g1_i1.p1  ORF type:complete len:424 (-),score=65.14 TRINITY_DN14059_c0_g1_i1:48-1319(-)
MERRRRPVVRSKKSNFKLVQQLCESSNVQVEGVSGFVRGGQHFLRIPDAERKYQLNLLLFGPRQRADEPLRKYIRSVPSDPTLFLVHRLSSRETVDSDDCTMQVGEAPNPTQVAASPALAMPSVHSPAWNSLPTYSLPALLNDAAWQRQSGAHFAVELVLHTGSQQFVFAAEFDDYLNVNYSDFSGAPALPADVQPSFQLVKRAGSVVLDFHPDPLCADLSLDSLAGGSRVVDGSRILFRRRLSGGQVISQSIVVCLRYFDAIVPVKLARVDYTIVPQTDVLELPLDLEGVLAVDQFLPLLERISVEPEVLSTGPDLTLATSKPPTCTQTFWLTSSQPALQIGSNPALDHVYIEDVAGGFCSTYCRIECLNGKLVVHASVSVQIETESGWRQDCTGEIVVAESDCRVLIGRHLFSCNLLCDPS